MKVDVYFNLHKKCFSVKAREGAMRGRVIAHALDVVLRDVTFPVSRSGHARVLREGRKNVHAFMRGDLVATDAGSLYPGTAEAISYNPQRGPRFYRKHDDAAVVWADRVDARVIRHLGVPQVFATSLRTARCGWCGNEVHPDGRCVMRIAAECDVADTERCACGAALLPNGGCSARLDADLCARPRVERFLSDLVLVPLVCSNRARPNTPGRDGGTEA